jgi:hypothetical protein
VPEVLTYLKPLRRDHAELRSFADAIRLPESLHYRTERHAS